MFVKCGPWILLLARGHKPRYTTVALEAEVKGKKAITSHGGSNWINCNACATPRVHHCRKVTLERDALLVVDTVTVLIPTM